YSSRISLRGRSAASLRQNCVTVFSFSKNHFSSPSGRWSIVLLISSWGSTLYHCANSSINFSVTDTNSSRTSEAALWPSTYISPLSNSTPCIRKDRISSKSLMRKRFCLFICRALSSIMVICMLTIIELNALHTKRQNLFQELDAVIHLLMEAKHWGLRKSRNATSLNSRFKSLDTLKVKIISVTFRRVIRTNHKKASKIWRHENIQLGGCQS